VPYGITVVRFERKGPAREADGLVRAARLHSALRWTANDSPSFASTRGHTSASCDLRAVSVSEREDDDTLGITEIASAQDAAS